MTTPDAATRGYRERLYVPIRWWLLLSLFLGSLWLALAVSTPALALWLATSVLLALGGGVLLGYGSARIEVDRTALRAGRARLEWGCCGVAVALDEDATRRLRGVDADARAFLLLRPYLGTAVRVDVADATDPTPYWLLSTRHPRRLAEAVNSARVVAD